MPAERMQGRVHLKTPRYSFIIGNDGKIYFLHVNNVKSGGQFIEPGVLVDFNVVPPMPGKPHPIATDAVVGGGL